MSRSALVTGGTGGIGSAIVRRLRANGYDVVFCGRDEQRAAALERATGAVFSKADATDRTACDASVAFALERLGVALLFVRAVLLLALPASEHARQVPAQVNRYTGRRHRAHSSSGLGHRPLTAAARVRIPYGPFLVTPDTRGSSKTSHGTASMAADLSLRLKRRCLTDARCGRRLEGHPYRKAVCHV
jgi:NAD(P)-dependent dehydrogenase (short-subunit alcohol dehydrogenase family)